eukprot:CAMPEP_0117753124 /NCGR_PEP_ID=MMETSP0947-20121206/12034_1 /TAXON_ID=44440 /ORGANISM="Chattonella subsalsa, Strain CCMP2191" /LENGTH=291 /DNA_ID=CAMNT_0005571937 /DNA_START=147 /DNA_END=1022 /DNA_ORIENTATION=-
MNVHDPNDPTVARIRARIPKPKKKVKARQCRQCGDWNKGVVENACYVCVGKPQSRPQSGSSASPQPRQQVKSYSPAPNVSDSKDFPPMAPSNGAPKPNKKGVCVEEDQAPKPKKKGVCFQIEEVTEQLSGWEIGEKEIEKRERRQMQSIESQRDIGKGAHEIKALTQHRLYDKKVEMSGNDQADIWAKNDKYDIWDEQDVIFAYHFIMEIDTRIPNKTFQQGGRLYRLINTLQNSCEHLHDVMNEVPMINTISNDRLDDIRKKYIAPLAKKVLEMIEEREQAENSDSDFSM